MSYPFASSWSASWMSTNNQIKRDQEEDNSRYEVWGASWSRRLLSWFARSFCEMALLAKMLVLAKTTWNCARRYSVSSLILNWKPSSWLTMLPSHLRVSCLQREVWKRPRTIRWGTKSELHLIAENVQTKSREWYPLMYPWIWTTRKQKIIGFTW